MLEIAQTESLQDYQIAFENLQKQTNLLFPNLDAELKTFNESYITVENYQQYINSLNEIPSSTVSNSVS